MQNSKRYEVLDALPTYGEMYVPVSHNGELFSYEGYVVRFYRSDGSEWVANFKGGLDGLTGVYELQDKNKFAVFASGECYIMNPDSTKPLDIFGVQFQEVHVTQQHQILAIDLTSITIIEPTGEHWFSERISWDGFKDLNFNEDFVTGLSYDPMNQINPWVAFTLNFKTKEITGGSYRRYEFKPKSKKSNIYNESMKKSQLLRRNYLPLELFNAMKFNSPYVNFTRYLNKKINKISGPDKRIVWICWIVVIVAFIVAFIKLFQQ
jgi:hypothetical protein